MEGKKNLVKTHYYYYYYYAVGLFRLFAYDIESQLALLNTKVCIFRDKIEKKILNVFKLCTR